MSDLSIVTQAANIIPPRKNNVIVIAVDSTSRSYDIRTLQLLGGKNYIADQASSKFFLTLQADGADIYYKFNETSPDTILETTAVAAGTALTPVTSGSSMQGALSNNYCMKLVNKTKEPFSITWGEDRFLILKTASGTANLRLYVSSNLNQ